MARLLFIPGMLLTPRVFEAQAGEFRGRAGIGFAGTLGMSSIAGMAERALEESGGDELVPVGLSMGGYVALEIARLAPDRVCALVVMDSNAGTDSPERREERRRIIEASGIGRFRGATRSLLESILSEPSLKNETLADTVMDMAGEVGRDNFILQQKAVMGRRDQFDTLAALDCPSLFMVGSEDVPYIEPMRRMAAAVGGADYVEIEGAGHLPPIETPDAVNAALAGFLERNGLIAKE